MATNIKTHPKPFLRVPVGEHIAEELAAKGQSVAQLADQMAVPATVVEHLLSGLTPLTVELANKLEQAWGIRASFWLNIDAKYQEWRASQLAHAKSA